MATASKKSSRKRKLTAEDLFKLRIMTSVSMDPSESRVAYCVERMDKKENKYFTNISLLDIKTGESAQFTHGDHVDSSPVWSPDGMTLAFVSTRNKKTGIYLMPVSGGAEKQIIELDGSISNLQFTPDGRHLVFGLRYNDSHSIKDEKEKKKAPVFRHVTRLFHRLDGLGYLPKDQFQVYALDVETGQLRKITKGKRENLFPALSPDGKLIAYMSNRSRDEDVDMLRNDLFVIPFAGGKERKIPTPPGPIYNPAFSPDGKKIAYIGHDNPDDAWAVTNYHVWTVGVSGRPKARDLMPSFDRMALDQSISDMADFHDAGTIRWSADGKRLYFASSDTGSTNLFYVSASGGRPTRVFGGKCHVKGFSISGKTRTAALIRSDLNNPGDLFTCPTTYGADKKARRHTDLNPFLRTEVKLGRTREVFFSSADGTRVQGWLVTPPDFSPRRKYPSILEIHGGPRTQYAFTFFHEMQFLAAKGYVVFYTNPRGGSGRGETWADAIAGGWGELDYMDCMAAADYLEKQRFINRRKMGVTGGSYGGYMTNWIIGHTDRFAAAVTQRSVVDLTSFFGSSDIGWALEREFDGTPWKNRDNYDKCSPIQYYQKVKTPVLIIHSENDLRCNIEQAQQMFVRLKRLGKKVEMVQFPEEPHGLSRHGRPDRRIARLNWLLKWFDRYLKG
ncbi:MAG: S9 family peptidase [Candidatus Zixiibacteriota bacterium]|nr:MAG: S9 family peptidase [candidate division Zixibacteria bacterium]